jgi:hypothetical protein
MGRAEEGRGKAGEGRGRGRGLSLTMQVGRDVGRGTGEGGVAVVCAPHTALEWCMRCERCHLGPDQGTSAILCRCTSQYISAVQGYGL